MDAEDYDKKAKALLMDKNTYKAVKTDPSGKCTQQLRRELETLKDNRLITSKMRKIPQKLKG